MREFDAIAFRVLAGLAERTPVVSAFDGLALGDLPPQPAVLLVGSGVRRARQLRELPGCVAAPPRLVYVGAEGWARPPKWRSAIAEARTN